MLPLRRGLTIAGRYRLVEQLGVGGMSEVWRGHDEVLDRPVAVKVLTGSLLADASLRGLIRQEAVAMAQLSHPNVTSVFDYGEFTTDDASVPFVVLELLHGQTLGRLLAAGSLPWPEAVRVVAQVAAALSAAHRQGLVHCDVTPANVMLTDSGVKVLDFGVAAVLGGTPSADGQPRFGTAGYIAPERLTPDQPVGPAVDVYGLGALLYAALVGQPPLLAQDRGESKRMLTADLPALMQVGLHADVADLCVRCLAYDPADRPDSAEVARALAAAVRVVPSGLAAGTSASGTAPRTGTLRLPPPDAADTAPLLVAASQARMWPRPLLLAAALVVAGLLLAGVYLLSASAPSQRATTPPAPTISATATATPPRPTPTRGTDPAAVAALRQVVLAGRAAGEIRADCAEDLLSRIADLQRGLDRGRRDDALHRIEQIREDIDERVDDGDITAQRAAALRAALAAIVI